MSNPDKKFTTTPRIDISFRDEVHNALPMDFPGLVITFDPVMDGYPAGIKIEASRDGTEVYTETFNVTSFTFSKIVPLKAVDRISLIFLSTREPHQYVRVTNIRYGFGIDWTNNEISSKGITKSVEIDPINRRLPRSTVNINVLDHINEDDYGRHEHLFNLDNPDGIYGVIENRLPFSIHYGKTVHDPKTWGDVGKMDWGGVNRVSWGRLFDGKHVKCFKAGTYLTDGKPIWSDGVVQINGRDLISSMTGEYHKGTYGRKSLYDIALDVINDAGLSPRDDGRDHFVLHGGLKRIYTESPMPVLPHNECLRLIAHASNCVLYTDVENIGYIRPIEDKEHGTIDEQHDYSIGFDVQTAPPVSGLTPSLYAVDSEVTYWGRATGVSTLYETEVKEPGTHRLLVKHKAAVGIEVTIDNGSVIEMNDYAYATELAVSVTKAAKVKLTGFVLNTTHEMVRVYNDDGDSKGEVEVLKNVLVNDRETAVSQAEYVRDWLRLRTTYTIKFRGDPALEVLDKIFCESAFTEKFSARVLRYDWSFNGILDAGVTVKNLESAR